MVKVRLFAEAAEIAGDRVLDVEATSLEVVSNYLKQEYGKSMVEVLQTSQVWVNGQPQIETDLITSTDEVAIIPPVSGG